MKAYGGQDYDVEVFKRKEEYEVVRGAHPEVPETFVLKSDCLRRGVTFTVPAIENLQDPKVVDLAASIEFQWHQMDHTASYQIPFIFHFADGTAVGTRVSPAENDPYIIELIDGKYYISWGEGEPIKEIFFDGPPEHTGVLLSGGMPAEIIAHYSGDAFYFVPWHHCAYWNKDEQCRFCDLDYFAKHQMKMGKGFKTRQSPKDLYEVTCLVLKEKGRWSHCFINGGSDFRGEYGRDYEYNIDLVAAVNQAAKDTLGVDRFPIYMVMAVGDKDQLQRIYDAGVSAFGSYMETWDPEQFKLTCPGKAGHLGRDRFIERTVAAVEVFGKGNVAMGFVPGVEMAPPPYGFENVDDALASTLEGYAFLVENDIVPLGTQWSIEPGTDFYRMGAKQPPLEFFVRLDKGRYRILKDNEEKKGYGISADFLCYQCQCWNLYGDYQRLL